MAAVAVVLNTLPDADLPAVIPDWNRLPAQLDNNAQKVMFLMLFLHHKVIAPVVFLSSSILSTISLKDQSLTKTILTNSIS